MQADENHRDGKNCDEYYCDKNYGDDSHCDANCCVESLAEKEEKSRRKLLARLAELSLQMEKYNIAAYLEQLNNPRRYFMVNFLGGVVRGLGIVFGMTILGALVLYILQKLVVLRLPLIGDFIADLVRIVLTYL